MAPRNVCWQLTALGGEGRHCNKIRNWARRTAKNDRLRYRACRLSDRIVSMLILRTVSVGIIVASFLAAQTSGTITGTVTDSTRAVMPGVKVSAKLSGAGERRDAATNGTGQYTFPFLAPGEYEIEFESPGFATIVRKVKLNVTERIAVDAVLQPSTVTGKVEVTAAGPLLQTESAAL